MNFSISYYIATHLDFNFISQIFDAKKYAKLSQAPFNSLLLIALLSCAVFIVLQIFFYPITDNVVKFHPKRKTLITIGVSTFIVIKKKTYETAYRNQRLLEQKDIVMNIEYT